MNKQQKLKRIIELMVRKQLRESYRYDSCFDYDYLRKVGISDDDISKLVDSYSKIADRTGDEGTCVLGNGIKINGKIAIRSYSQGSIGIERIQKVLIPFLQQNYPNLKISYEWGHMD